MVRYFGFGSNMNTKSLRAKGVEPFASQRAVLDGWRLAFNVQHFFRHEGGVGNIVPSEDPNDRVCGVVHDCADSALELLDAAEAYGHGYDRIKVVVQVNGEIIPALCYVGMPEFIDDACLPSRRYLNILTEGARDMELDSEYMQYLNRHPVHSVEEKGLFKIPSGDYATFDERALSKTPSYTSLFGSVFDMSDARPLHHYLKEFFGGRDMTLFHLKRLDSSDGNETMGDIREGRLNKYQKSYLNGYLNEYAKEYRYVGRINYK